MEKEYNYMKKILIKSRLYNYEVEFVDELTQLFHQFPETTMFVIDKNIYDLYKDKLNDIKQDHIFLIDAIEAHKNINTIMDLIYFWKNRDVKKNHKVVCIGGGITQDITTFATNIYLRNIDWYFIPTTLLSMCDSCIGGKCGINLDEYKNQLGVFYPPKKIFIDTRFLKTLSKNDLINGWGELLKFSLTSDFRFFEKLSQEKDYLSCDNIEDYIYKGLLVKKDIIEKDEFEGDLRRVLNYGHTFGHALEAFTENVIPHGQGVIWGIDVANYIACKKGILNEKEYLLIKELIKTAFLPKEIKINNPEKVIEIVKKDKKVKDNVVYMALLSNISHLEIIPIKLDDELLCLFDNYLEETHAFYSH